MQKRTRLAKLIAVFDRFYESITNASGDGAVEWVGYWDKLRPTYVNPPPGVTRSQLSGGLAQGLLEMPLLFGDMPASERRVFSMAYKSAIEAEYPEFLQAQQDRLEKIVAKGRISNESQFYLVRHAIDLLEGDPARTDELSKLYRLVEQFERRGR
jgi:hypothetical protein